MSKKKWIIITTIMMTMLLGIAGCGKNTDDKEGADASAVTAEDLSGSEEVDGNVEEAEKDDANADAPGADGENTSGADNTDAQGGTPHYIEEEKDLYGDIWEVGGGQFTVTEIYVETEANGGEVMAAPAEDVAEEMPKITVVYDEDTRFVRKKIWDGGASHEEKEGSAADLKKGLTAQMKGGYEGDVFHATEIFIVEVILN